MMKALIVLRINYKTIVCPFRPWNYVQILHFVKRSKVCILYSINIVPWQIPANEILLKCSTYFKSHRVVRHSIVLHWTGSHRSTSHRIYCIEFYYMTSNRIAANRILCAGISCDRHKIKIEHDIIDKPVKLDILNEIPAHFIHEIKTIAYDVT